MIYSEVDKMLLLRWKMRKLNFISQVQFNSSTYKQVKTKNKELPNPFKNKSYLDIINIMNTGIFQKNEMSISKLLIEDALIRAEQAIVSRDNLSLNQIDARQRLMNTVIQKMLSRMKDLSFQEILLVIKMFNSANESRSFKISNKNKQIYKTQIQNRIRSIIEEDKSGTHKESLKKILYAIVESPRRLLITRDIIQYLGKHDFKDNKQMLIFLQKISPAKSKSGNFDGMLEVFIERFLNPQLNNLENACQWVKPIVFEYIRIYTNGIRLEGNNYLSKFLVGLEHQFKNKQIEINEQAWFFCQLLQFISYQSPYVSKIEDIARFSKLIYEMMRDLKQKIKTDQLIAIQNLQKLMQSRYMFENFFQLSYLSLHKQYKQLSQEFEQFISQVFKFQIVQKYERFTPKDLASVINIDIHHTPQIEEKFVKSLIKLLVKTENQGIYLITRLRIYQYIVKTILSNNLKINLAQFEGLLRTIQKNARKLKDYQTIRIYNIFRLLNLESPVIQSIFKLIMERKPAAITQNLSRTSLKRFSIPVIIDSLDYLKDKYYKNKGQNAASVVQGFWSSCKKTKRQYKQPNRDQILKYWLSENKEYFADITKSYKNCYRVMSSFISQINMNSKNISNSINYELFLQAIKSWIDQNLMVENSEENNVILDNLKHFVESQNVSALLQIQYRHSFFIKTMWVQLLLSEESQHRNQSYLKRTKQIRLSQVAMKFLKPNIYRNRMSIKHSILKKYAKTFNFAYELKHRMFQQTLNTYLWMSYHKIELNQEQDKNKGIYFSKQFENFVESKVGILGLIQLSIYFARRDLNVLLQRLIQKNCIPSELLDGTLTRQTSFNQIILLDLLAYPQLLIFLFKKYTGLADVFIQKITDIECPNLYIKIVQAANLVNKHKQHILPSTYGQFTKWLWKTLENYYQPQLSPQFAHLWVQNNYSNQNSRGSVLDYVKAQLNQGNFYFASLFYINGYTGIEDSVAQLFQLTNTNQVMKFMQYFKDQQLSIITWFLGLSLNQQKISLIQLFAKKIMKPEFHKFVLNMFENNKEVVYQLYLLLTIAKHRLSQKKQVIEAHKTIKYVQQQIQFGIHNIETICLERVKQRTWKSLQKFAPNLYKATQKNTKSGFPMQIQPYHRYKDKILLIDQNEPGYIKNVQQYINKVTQLGETIVIREIDLINIQSLSS